jgi:hypothetical protein
MPADVGLSQSEREKMNAKAMHQAFQQALCRLRLQTSRSFAQTLSNGFGPGKPAAFCAQCFRCRVMPARSKLGARVEFEAAGEFAGAGPGVSRQSHGQEFGCVRLQPCAILGRARLLCARVRRRCSACSCGGVVRRWNALCQRSRVQGLARSVRMPLCPHVT